ncbi:hypothetical protein RCL1_007726 [Eukaryota sp. TZLM3-RCL]
MPLQKGKGGKARKRAKGAEPVRRELILKEEGQEYAQVMRVLGNARVEAQCFDGKRRLCHVRGKLRRCAMRVSDIILVSLRDYQDSKADIIGKYTVEEARQLKKLGEIPESVATSTTTSLEDDVVQFEHDNEADADLFQDSRVGMMPPSSSEDEYESEEEQDLNKRIDDL